MTDFYAQMQADAEEIAKDFEDQKLTELGIQALAIEEEISSLEEQRKEKSKMLEKLMRYVIPLRLRELGIPAFSFDWDEGTASIGSGIAVFASLNKAPDEQRAVDYLEANGLAGAVKTVVSVDFVEGDRESAEALRENIKTSTGHDPLVKRSINAATLRSFLKGKLEEDPDFDYERVGGTAFVQASFTKRR